MVIRKRAFSTRKTEGMPRNLVQNLVTFRLTSKKDFDWSPHNTGVNLPLPRATEGGSRDGPVRH